MSFPSFLIPNATSDLMRVGSKNDGGYVVPRSALLESKSLLTFGLSADWSFEEQFATATKGEVAAFDATVTNYFWLKYSLSGLIRGMLELNPRKLCCFTKYFRYCSFFDQQAHRHFKKFVGFFGEGYVTFSQALRMTGFLDNIMLKIDIEGGEYRILSQIIDAQEKFTAIIIEFHDIDLHVEKIERFFQSLSTNFSLVHFHANNSSRLYDMDIPAHAIELTFVNRNLLTDASLFCKCKLPIASADSPNNPSLPDIEVSFGT